MAHSPFAAAHPVHGAVSQAAASERLTFLRKVYSLFLLGLGIAGAGGYIGMRALEAVMSNYIVLVIGYFATFIVCQWQRKVFPLNIALFGLFTFISGLFWGPTLAFYLLAGQGAVLGHALGLTACIFVGLTVYTLTSKTDFSFMGGALTIGIFSLFGLILFGWLFGGFADVMHFLICVGAVILFSGFVLYDTSRILHHYRTDEYVVGALALYLDFVLMLWYILHLLGRRD